MATPDGCEQPLSAFADWSMSSLRSRRFAKVLVPEQPWKGGGRELGDCFGRERVRIAGSSAAARSDAWVKREILFGPFGGEAKLAGGFDRRAPHGVGVGGK